MLLSITAAHAHAIDNVSLFCFVAKPPSLVRARRARSPVDDIQLAVLPTTVPHPSGIRPTVDWTATYRTRSRKRRTSDCFFLYNSPMYLYAPILYCRQLNQCWLNVIHSFSEASIHLLQKYLQLNITIMERTVPSPLKGILDKSLSSPVVNTSDLNLCVRTLVLNEQSRFKYRTPSGNFRDHPRVLHSTAVL